MYNLSGLEFNDVDIVTNNNRKQFINVACSFDIETTSTYTKDGEKIAFMYAWAFSIKNGNFVFYGRTWNDFIELCNQLSEHYQLSKNRVLVCYSHNLAYEFQFMRKYFNWHEVFAPETRKPLRAVTTQFIEFRDTYKLSGYGLDKLADNLEYHDIEKLTGELDHNLVRHHKTELTAREWQYLTNDVLIVLYYIQEKMYRYREIKDSSVGNIKHIPLTKTGVVRQFVKNHCFQLQDAEIRDKDRIKPYDPAFKRRKKKNIQKSRNSQKWTKYNKQFMQEVAVLSEHAYDMNRNAFQGGFVHANSDYQRQVLSDVTSIDITSSYPAVMLSEKFPMSAPYEVDFKSPDFDLDHFIRTYDYKSVFTIKFVNLKPIFHAEQYISESHCYYISEGKDVMNGRVYSADELDITITDVDYSIIKQVYTWDSMYIKEMYKYQTDYLPTDVIRAVLELYEKKTELKGVSGQEIEYTLTKNMLNSVYGMSVTDPVKDSKVYKDGRWTSEDGKSKAEQLEDHNTNKARFLYYPWGVFISAYARRNLWTGILHMDNDYVYSDTDAIMFFNYEDNKDYIRKYNKWITRKLEKMADIKGFSYDRLKPVTNDGEIKPLGIWEVQGHYSRFKTLGAKKYIVEHAETKEIEITVSGLNKKHGLEYLKGKYKTNKAVIENFDFGLHIPAGQTGKLSRNYIDDTRSSYITDYQGNTEFITAGSSLYLEPDSYTMEKSERITNNQENTIIHAELWQLGYEFHGMAPAPV